MLNTLIVLIMIAIVASLSFGLYFLVQDRGHSDRTVISLSVRVGLAVLLLVVLAFGFMSRLPA